MNGACATQRLPQPNFVPLMPNTSRNTQRGGVSPSTSTLYVFPFTFMVKAEAPSPFVGSPCHLGAASHAC
jgi:hypothetical protein